MSAQDGSEELRAALDEIYNDLVWRPDTDTDDRQEFQRVVTILVANREQRLLDRVRRKAEKFARPKTYTCVISEDGTTEEREGIELIEAVPLSALDRLQRPEGEA